MDSLDQVIQPHPDVVDTKLDDAEVVLLHLDSKTYYSLNLTGGRVWRGLKEGLTLRAISQRIQAGFDVDPEDADRSVLELAGELCAQRLALPATTES
jgi:Coenzyme PQQ synthesis protein D (PqqD)